MKIFYTNVYEYLFLCQYYTICICLFDSVICTYLGGPRLARFQSPIWHDFSDNFDSFFTTSYQNVWKNKIISRECRSLGHHILHPLILRLLVHFQAQNFLLQNRLHLQIQILTHALGVRFYTFSQIVSTYNATFITVITQPCHLSKKYKNTKLCSSALKLNTVAKPHSTFFPVNFCQKKVGN